MRTVEVIAGAVLAVAALNLLVQPRSQSPAVINSIFGGSSQLVGALTNTGLG